MSQAHLHASELFSVKGRVAVITGGGSGLGSIMARALAVNGASKVFILGRREEALRNTASQGPEGIIIPVQCDVTSKESLDAAYKSIAEKTDYVEVLFVNSGINGPSMVPGAPGPDGPPPLTEVREKLYSIPMSEFNKTMDVNVTGAYYTILAFLPLLEAANKRRPAPQRGVLTPPTAQVIITSSIAAFNRRPAHGIAYNVSKAAVDYLTKACSTMMLPYHIRVNGIAPGLYFSEMSQSYFGGDSTAGISEGEFPAEIIPLTRSGASKTLRGSSFGLRALPRGS
ncbi:Short-chain dehydrogenase/reductase SAT3 [Penicillium chermesinum]|uniref:Short-chain dehydrogenase/reductase SAT3 n=1 Tax=Penicillium chermesinum TaxID=63820 RepID=A0A9W9PGT0_9EURO|nr:Short-chain dehydrogenase/reductase SAT3 [Penicillium chermesinum]KAJ5246558.1 Short-chain dehydrogenase/reductase SAT3 [Penicillium chermesinum]